MKHLLFEDNGDFKAGTLMSEAGSSLQVELASGKRAKVKASHVLLRFDAPAPDALLPAARELAEEIDVDFLWECAPQEEFAFTDLADEYFGGHATPAQATALLIRLQGAPVYFHRKGRGHYRPAPADTLKAALAALERKRQQEAQIEHDAREMIEGRLPQAVAEQAAWLLVRPDKMSLTWKAFERALAATGRGPERLLLELGAFASARDLHMARFAAEHFPHGFGISLRRDPLDGFAGVVAALPLAEVEAFSVDDSTTTEIDDALSVRRTERGWRVGIHIAAPALAIAPGSELDLVARERMSTVYMPGGKITMLPEPLIAACSLDEGREMPALSLYLDLDEDGETIVGRFSQADRVRVAANLRHDLLDGVYTEAALDAGRAPAFDADGQPLRFAEELRVLWKLSLALCAERERFRGKPEPRFRADFSFYLDPDGDGDEPRVRIVPRRRDSPLDRIVAEMAILANSEWGGLLGEHDVPGIYRSQQNGRVRVTSHPLPHQGLGVSQYMWSSSPLRRYVDLVNQRQLIAVLAGDKPPFGQNDADLFSVMSAFDAKYTAYADFQQRMERYWCLRWVAQQGLTRVDAVVVRDDLVRLVDAPLYFRLPGMPMLPAGRRFKADILATDDLDLSVEARFVEAEAAGSLFDEADDEPAVGSL
ncbi:RNB domain-containing ribonuclease [Burkholderiaceae bacterium FT117]|uniref:ribonuclease catalytic domain-containing protein n=1 Tax=Zeimonas sediminis TaxID=2944268 RepID=UPI002342CAEE|nr:RNB domain-containing ribonuclease [Zeimonas sediminis]MCM5570682.1 RNB domain-containing ribonuclease [Zeimonas sediminis]